MNSPTRPPRKITAAQVAQQLLTVSRGSTVRAFGMAQPLEDLAAHLVDQETRIAELERQLRAKG